MNYAALSADIVSSTSLTLEETIALTNHLKNLLNLLESHFEGFWGRQIKGDYIECIVPNPKDALRISLIIKTAIKSFGIDSAAQSREFQDYGVRIAIGIGPMRLIDKEHGIMDGEAIYLAGRNLEKNNANTKGTLTIATSNDALSLSLNTIGLLTDAQINNCTSKQCEIIFYKLLSMKEIDIAQTLNISQATVNKHSTAAKWYCIEEAVKYFEQIKLEDYE